MFAERLANWTSSNWSLLSGNLDVQLWKGLLEAELTYFIKQYSHYFPTLTFEEEELPDLRDNYLLVVPLPFLLGFCLRKILWPKQATLITT